MMFWITAAVGVLVVAWVLNIYVSVRNNRINPKDKRFTIKIGGERDTVFDGTVVAEEWWFAGGMVLYKTNGGNYVCYRVACYSDEILRVIPTKGRTQKSVENAITDFFGDCNRAKRLYKRSRISDAAYADFIE